MKRENEEGRKISDEEIIWKLQTEMASLAGTLRAVAHSRPWLCEKAERCARLAMATEEDLQRPEIWE